MKIIPAILEESYEEIEDRAESVPEAISLHVDICDGVFVDHQTWPYASLKSPDLYQDFNIHQLLTEETGLPRWEEIDYQFDLMIKDPQKTLDTWLRIGAGTLIFHPTSFTDKEDFINVAENTRAMLTNVGVAFTYDEWVENREFADQCLSNGVVDIFQCMSIREIGAQGAPFDSRWLAEIENLKNQYPTVMFQMDGGINKENIENIEEAGIDKAVIGSGIFKEGNASENLDEFRSIADQE